MQLLLMAAAQRHSELITELAAVRPGLGKFQMVGTARGLLAHQAGLLPDK